MRFWLLLLVLALFGCGSHQAVVATHGSGPGFTSADKLEQHFHKHGSEFGSVDQTAYLTLAQTLRDAPVGGDILEAKREDGVTTRFDRATGAFIAFNQDRTIRTFFKPNDGERYFERQLHKSHD